MFNPISDKTVVSPDGYEWRPATFSDFLEEIQHLKGAINEACFFRGHKKNDWLLDSTFARKMKVQRGLIETDNYSVRQCSDVAFQHELIRILLDQLKAIPMLAPILLGHSLGMSIGSRKIDLVYEYLKHWQQNQNDQAIVNYFPFGTNLLDFTYDWKVALYFANSKRTAQDEGAMFLIRQTSLGQVLYKKQTPLQDLFQIVNTRISESPIQEYGGLPCFPWPDNQVNNTLDPKPKRQNVVYIAQMDFRLDLASSWKQLYQQTQKQVFVKLVLPPGTCEEVHDFLFKEGMTEDYLFPPTKFDKP